MIFGPIDEEFLMRHASRYDPPAARFTLQMAFDKKAPWFENNLELTNLLLSIAQSDRPDWLPAVRDCPGGKKGA